MNRIVQRRNTPKRCAAFSLFGLLLSAFTGSTSAQVYNTNGQPQPLVLPVSTNESSGVITVGDQTCNPNGNAGVHIVRIQRGVPSSNIPVFVEQNTFTDAASINSYLQGMKSTGDMVLMATCNSPGFSLGDIAKDLEDFGATTELEGSGVSLFSFISNGGLNHAQAYQAVGGFFKGYLAQDANSNYVFIRPDYVRYDLTTDGTIRVGSTTYPVSASPGCNNGPGGFNLVVLDRWALNQYNPVWINSYCTNTGYEDSDSQGVLALAHDLGTFSSNENVLVFLASWGKPTSPFFANLGNTSVGLQVRQLGGYWETFSELGVDDTYTLVGSAPPPNGVPGARNRAREGSSLYPGDRTGQYQSGALHGILARIRREAWYSPTTSDPTGTANFDLHLYLAQSPTAFPHPATPDEWTAFQTINSKLCGSTTCNVRDYYWNTNQSFEQWGNTLSNLGRDNSCGSTSSAFCTMQQQLTSEFGYLDDIRNFQTNLSLLWVTSGDSNLFTLLDVYQHVQDDIQADTNDQSISIVEDVFNSFLSAAGTFVPECGLADAVFNFTTNLITDLNGNGTTSQYTAVENLEEQAQKAFLAQGATIGTFFDLIYEDWGRMSSIGQAINEKRPGWSWNGSTTTSQIASRLTPLVERSYYRSLMAAHFAIGRFLPNDNNDHLWAAPFYYTASGTCLHIINPCLVHPFDGYYPFTYTHDRDPYNAYGYTMLNAPSQSMLTDGNWWLGISATDKNQHDSPYGAPGFNTLTYLFQAPDTTISGYHTPSLGVYRPEFFQS